MSYILPRNDSTSLSTPERTFLRSNALSSPALRLSGRSPTEPRPIRLSFCRSHNRSECISQFGQTRAAAGIRAELIPPPNNDRPNDGQIKFNVEVGPMACMGFDVVPPSSNYSGMGDAHSSGGSSMEQASYLQRLKSNRLLRLLERTLLIGGSIDAEALCVQSGVWVWRLVVDVSLMDDGGNAVDACVLAVVAALRHYRLPEVDVGGGGGGEGVTPSDEMYRETRIIHSDDKEPTPLPLHHTPLTATFALFADESGKTSAVSAFLDPTDREELACNGVLTWSYNKYGEMCCLDFPGGCELSPSQLMKSSILGKKRCVEICEMLEAALLEAEDKAQMERMERLKNLRSSTVVPFSDKNMEIDDGVFNEDAIMANNAAEADTRAEDEEYRKLALDYASGHIAASVKEDKSSLSIGKNRQHEVSSLFHALLHSVKSTPSDSLLESASVTLQAEEATMEGVPDSDMKTSEEKIMEIEMSHVDVKAGQKSVSIPCSTNLGEDSDEEENIVQLQSEFSVMPCDVPTAEAGSEPVTDESKAKAVAPEPKPVKQQSIEEEEEDQIDDLVMAVKKKKSKKSKKK